MINGKIKIIIRGCLVINCILALIVMLLYRCSIAMTCNGFGFIVRFEITDLVFLFIVVVLILSYFIVYKIFVNNSLIIYSYLFLLLLLMGFAIYYLVILLLFLNDFGIW